jgi:hypothetical protein
VLECRERPQQVLDALAALHPAEVEQLQRAGALDVRRVLLALDQERVRDLGRRRQRVRAVEAPVRAEHVATGP